MTASIIDGVAIARDVRSDVARRVKLIKKQGITPGLAVVMVGDDPASRVYVRNKTRACADVGLYSEMHEFPGDTAAAALLDCIEELNRKPAIHGVLVQLPLPPHLDARALLGAIDPAKDVDGFGFVNLGALADGHPLLVPCTPLGVMTLLDRCDVPLEGRNAVVVGRSSIVGKPMALLLIGRGATVTVCHSKTRDLAAHARSADVLIVATGKPGVITADMVKPGAVVIDVGINRLPDGRLCGDVDFEAVSRVASRITPVPGGVGPMTVAMLMSNTVDAAERSMRQRL
jgi:methylenetetrahydrofolate dehydrogenase (NADP+) / methenyltetrahydrofolate cyclohydrolase